MLNQKIQNYKLVIDQENYYFGFLLKHNEYDLSLLNNTNLEYSINHKNNTIQIFHNTLLLTFENIPKDMIYFAFKSPQLFVLVEDDNHNLITAYEAVICD